LQIEFLEVRLAEVMAYADIPINMRPALIELDAQQLPPGAASRIMVGAAPVQQPEVGGVAAQHSLTAAAAPTTVSAATAAGLAGVKVTQLELVRSALTNCLKMLKQMSDALGKMLLWHFIYPFSY
jgi:centrosomal protein CEP290